MIVYLQMLETAEDRAAFEQLYLTYRSLMYRIAYGILRNQQDAEDAYQKQEECWSRISRIQEKMEEETGKLLSE